MDEGKPWWLLTKNDHCSHLTQVYVNLLQRVHQIQSTNLKSSFGSIILHLTLQGQLWSLWSFCYSLTVVFCAFWNWSRDISRHPISNGKELCHKNQNDDIQ